MNCLLLVSLCSTLLPPGPLAGYRHPEWQTFKVGLSGSDLSFQANLGNGSWGYGSCGVTPYAEFTRSGEKLGLWAQISAPLSATPCGARRDGSSVYYGTWQAGDAGLSLRSAASWFPLSLPLGVHYTLDAGAGSSSRTEAGVWPESSHLTYTSRSSSASVRFYVGPAFGRVRDATPLLVALRAQEILREEGLIDRALPEADVEELARRIARRDYWSSAIRFDSYSRHWFDDVESFVRSRLRPGVEIPARVWFRVRDAATNAAPVYTESRLVGINFVPWVGFTAEHSRKREEWPQGRAWRETIGDTFEPRVGGMLLEAGYPVTTRLYFHLEARWTPDFDESLFVSRDEVDASVDYLIFDRLDLKASLEHDGNRQARGWWLFEEAARISAKWYVEDRLSVTGGLLFCIHAGRHEYGEYERHRGARLDASFNWRLF